MRVWDCLVGTMLLWGVTRGSRARPAGRARDLLAGLRRLVLGVHYAGG